MGAKWIAVVGLGLALAGCRPPVLGSAQEGEVGSATSSSADTSESASETVTATTTQTTIDTNDDATYSTFDSGCSYSGGFYAGWGGCDMSPSCGASCDIWSTDDCADGEKCTAVSCDVGSNSWDSNVCRDIGGAKQVGDGCSTPDIDGEDDCAKGLLCWNEQTDTGLGVCVAFCQGTPASPVCAAASLCVVANDGVLPICLPSCDPLVQECDGNDVCIPNFNDSGFVCVLNSSGDVAPYGTPCEFANSCNAGLICIAGESVPEPDCATASGCCSPVCDINEPNACPGAGQVCEAFYEAGAEPVGYEHIGVCAVPA